MKKLLNKLFLLISSFLVIQDNYNNEADNILMGLALKKL